MGLWLEEDGVGAAIEDEKLLVAVRIANRNRAPARDLQLTRIDLQHAALLKPAALPQRLGTIAGGKDAVVQLAFRRGRLVDGREYRLVIHGRSGAHDFELHCAVTLPVPEGERRARRATAPVARVSGATEAAGPPPRLKREYDDKRPPLPRGEFVGAPGPHGRPIEVREHAGTEILDYGGPGNPAPNPGIVFTRAGSTYVGNKGRKDPTGASVDLTTSSGTVIPLVVLSGNFYGEFSVDGGSTFTGLIPFQIFPASSFPLDGLPQDEGPIVGDYNLIYIPSVDRIVWQLLSRGSRVDPSAEEPHHWNRLRVAFTSPQEFIDSGGKSWSYWDMTTATFGLNNTDAFLDYPDVHFTAKGLYFSVSVNGGLLVIQVPLSDLQGGNTIHIGYTDPEVSKGANLARLVHYSPDAGYWAKHGSSSTELTVYEWPDGSDTYSWRTVKIDSWYDGDDVMTEDWASYTPDGTNWLQAYSPAVRGGTVQRDFEEKGGDVRRIVFAWSAPRTKAVPQPHVRIQPILRTTSSGTTTWSREPSTDMWHPDFAFNHVSLASNSKGELGVSVGAGGGGTKSGGSGSDATPVAGFLGDNTLYSIGVSTASDTIYGDYSAVRRHCPDERHFSVFDYYALDSPPPDGSGLAQYRMFARPADL